MEFGSLVNINEKYKRVWGTRKTKGWKGVLHDAKTKEWKRVKYEVKGCIFLGIRTLSNGFNSWEYDIGYVFEPIESFNAALVCPGPRINPIYVPLDAIEHF